MRLGAIVCFAMVSACASDAPQGLPSLVGTWQGEASNGYTTQYVFGADGSFQFGIVNPTGVSQLETGMFMFGDDNDSPLLTLTGTFTNPEDASTYQAGVQSLAYATGKSLCDAAFYPSGKPPSSGVIESWSSSEASWPIDTSGNPGTKSKTGDTYAFADDGTFTVNDLHGDIQAGTYTLAGKVVTVTIQQTGFESTRSLTRIDGRELEGSTAVLCDPVYTRQ
jgi:hypothetical protein